MGFGLFTGILFLIGNRLKAFIKRVTLYTEFSNLSGLTSGGKVRVSGIDAGQIKSVEIPKGPAEKFRLKLEVEEKTRGIIRKDSIASIETAA